MAAIKKPVADRYNFIVHLFTLHFYVGRYVFVSGGTFFSKLIFRRVWRWEKICLILTRVSRSDYIIAGAPDASVGHDGMPAVAPGLFEETSICRCNAAGIRDELQS